MTLFMLSSKERVALEHLAARTANATVLRRAQALLWLDDGESTQEIAEHLRVSRQTIYNWASRFQRRSALEVSARVVDGERPGRPRTAHGVIDPLIGGVLDRDPRELGYRSTVWTVPLLGQYLVDEQGIGVSPTSMRLALRRLGVRWKRPRHQLALRPETWRHAKGGSNAGWPPENGPSS